MVRRQGIRLIQDGKQTLLLILPLSIALGKACGYIGNIRRLFKIFAIGCATSAIISLAISTYMSIKTVDGSLVFQPMPTEYQEYGFWGAMRQGLSYFSYSELSHFCHNNYYAMYLMSGIITSYYLFVCEGKDKKEKTSGYIMLILGVMMEIMLNSRGNYIAMGVMWIVIAVHQWRRYHHKALSIAMTVISIAGVITLLIAGRGKVLTDQELTENDGKMLEQYKGIDTRFDIWIDATQIIIQNPIIGKGIGDADRELIEYFGQKNEPVYASREYDTHNQYIFATLYGGVFGLLALLAFLSWPLAVAIRRRNYMLLSLSLLVIIICMFENMLNCLPGILFAPIMTTLAVTDKSQDK